MFQAIVLAFPITRPDAPMEIPPPYPAKLSTTFSAIRLLTQFQCGTYPPPHDVVIPLAVFPEILASSSRTRVASTPPPSPPARPLAMLFAMMLPRAVTIPRAHAAAIAIVATEGRVARNFTID